MIVPDVSVVLPVSRRAHDLAEVVGELAAAMKGTGKSFEVVMVVDGDLPERLDAARKVAEGRDDVRVLRFARRFGEGAALQAGLAACRAPVLVTWPAYFQVTGAVVPRLLAALEDGADLAFASRQSAGESFFNRVQRGCFHFLLRRCLGIRFRDVACGVRAMRREVLETIAAHGAFHRFITVAAIMSGFETREVAADVHAVARSSRAYSPFTYLQRLLDIANVLFVTRFLHKPLRFFGAVGAGLFVPGFLICLYLSIRKVFFSEALGERPLFLFGVILAVLGFQILAIGLLGEIISFAQARRQKAYAIREVIRKKGAGAGSGPATGVTAAGKEPK